MITMTMGKRDVEKRLKDLKQEVAALEAKCQGGGGKKEDYELLAKLKRKLN